MTMQPVSSFLAFAISGNLISSSFTPRAKYFSSRAHAARRTLLPSQCRVVPRMIQSPSGDGPPDLSAYFDKKARAVGASGPPISVATGRARVNVYGGNSLEAGAAALQAALSASAQDGPAQLCHCTVSLDVDARAVASALRTGLGDGVPILGRSVNKRDADGTVEVMLLRSDEIGGIVVKSAAGGTFADVARQATAEAVAGLASPNSCTFLIFAHTPGAGADIEARNGIDTALPGVIAYGGPAVGSEETGVGWTLLDGAEAVEGGLRSVTVAVAAVPGSINFLISSVVKSWAQPAYTEPLSYMIPSYTGDASTDLLTAIRYDDWDKFIWCIEDQGVSVNVLWPEKQNQSPLLAACARVRTRMIAYMISAGADVHHRNAGNFTAAMYTRKLTEYDPDVVLAQLRSLRDAGLDVKLSTQDELAVRNSGSDGRIFMDDP
jgi:hypothetical protein